MVYKARELRRLWELVVYVGDPDAEKPKTKKETVVAFNPTDAVRRAAPRKLAVPAVALCFVTWPEEADGPVYEIYSTAGPTNKKVKPTIDPEGWDF
jgi:hypothetical protein